MDSLTIKTPKIHKISFLGTKKEPKPVHVNFHTSECPLCTIPAREPLIYEDNLIYLVKTNQMKGHKIRVMAVLKLHEAEPSFEARIRCTIKLYEYMTQAVKSVTEFHRGRVSGISLEEADWYMVDDTHCSIPNHFHLMACDSLGSEDPMLYETPRVHFPLEPSS